MSLRYHASALLAMTLLHAAAVAEEPTKAEPLPLPRAQALPIVSPRPMRVSAYDVWQYYGVDHSGRFRPRVIYSSHGSYFLATGQPYPWFGLSDRYLVPTVTSPATFGDVPLPFHEIPAVVPAFMPYVED